MQHPHPPPPHLNSHVNMTADVEGLKSEHGKWSFCLMRQHVMNGWVGGWGGGGVLELLPVWTACVFTDPTTDRSHRRCLTNPTVLFVSFSLSGASSTFR